MSDDTERQQTIGRREAVAIVIGTTLGSSVYVHPRDAVEILGTIAPIVYPLATIGVLSIVVGYAVFASSPLGARSGGTYFYVSRTWHSRSAGFAVAWFNIVAYLGMLALASLGVGAVLTDLFGLPSRIGAIAFLTILFVFNAAGARTLSRVEVGLVVAFVVLLSISFAVGFVEFVPGNFAAASLDVVGENGLIGPIRTATTVATFAFLGFEAISQFGDEVERPHETMPWALLVGVGVASAVYVSTSVVTLGVIHWTRFPGTTAPFADAVAGSLPVSVATLVTCGSLLGHTTTGIVAFAVPSRLLRSLSRDGVVPAVFGWTDDRFEVPIVGAIVTYVVMAALVVTSAFQYALFVTLVGFVLMYATLAVSTAALPIIRPRLYKSCRLQLHPLALVGLGLVGAVSVSSIGWFVFTHEPWQTLPLTQFEPIPAAIDRLLLRDVGSSVLWSSLVCSFLGGTAYLVYGDYRLTTEAGERPPIDAAYATEDTAPRTPSDRRDG